MLETIEGSTILPRMMQQNASISEIASFMKSSLGT